MRSGHVSSPAGTLLHSCTTHFTGTVLCSSQDIPTFQRCWDRLFLDRTGLFESIRKDAHKELSAQRKVVERCALCRGDILSPSARGSGLTLLSGQPVTHLGLWTVVTGGSGETFPIVARTGVRPTVIHVSRVFSSSRRDGSQVERDGEVKDESLSLPHGKRVHLVA